MTTAYLLARAGKSVVVLDDGPIGGGMTERTTAHLSNAYDDRYKEMERLHGEDGARLIATSHTAAIDRIEAIIAEEGIDCDFERLDGYLFAPPGESKQILEDEMKAAHRAGLTEVEQVERAPIADFDTGMCLRFPRQGQFHPLKYLSGLFRAIERSGVPGRSRQAQEAPVRVTVTAAPKRMAKARTWIIVLLAIVGAIVIGLMVMAGVGTMWMMRHINTTSSTATQAVKAFEQERARFGTEKPLIGIEDIDNGAAVQRRIDALPTAAVKPTEMAILVWDPDKERTVRIALPFWLLKLGKRPHAIPMLGRQERCARSATC